MKLLIPAKVAKRLMRNLRGRIKECGGVVVGEHVEFDTFRIVDMSFQRAGGSVNHFVRDPAAHKRFLDEFFARTGGDYTRFNYLGEWHSHPMFEPLPSAEDIRVMYDLIEDSAVGVNFLILLIPKLRSWRVLELSATLFRVGVVPEAISVEVEPAPELRVHQRFISKVIDYLT